MAKYIQDERLTDEVIEEILNKCGLELMKTRENYMTGKVEEVQNIIRGEDCIIVSCINKEIQDMADIIASRMPIFGMLSRGSSYMPGDEIVTLDDFFAQRLKMAEEIDELDNKLFDTYHETICSIFGEEYEKDSQACFDEIIKQESENQKEKTESKKEDNSPAELGAE